MIVFVEDKQPLFEVVQLAGNREYNALVAQVRQNPKLSQMLTVPVHTIPKYRFLLDDSSPIYSRIKSASLLQIIEFSMKIPSMESYLIKTPKGLYVGFVAINLVLEDSRIIVDDVKTFSFGLDDSDNENQMYKDLPAFLDKCLAKYGKVSWTALERNKANRAYAIYTKRHKGVISKDGEYIRYVCVE
jgi:hypothetical protein